MPVTKKNARVHQNTRQSQTKLSLSIKQENQAMREVVRDRGEAVVEVLGKRAAFGVNALLPSQITPAHLLYSTFIFCLQRTT